MPCILTSQIPLNGGNGPHTAGGCRSGGRLEAMDAKISDLTVASTSIRADIAGFRETATDLDLCLTMAEDRVATLPNQETELRSLRAKVTDLEDRSRRDNVRLFGIPEYKEGSDIKTFLKNLLPELLMGLVFSTPLEFQRVHRIGPLHEATPDKPRPIIVCFLRYKQARQTISVASAQGLFSLEGRKIRVVADFSRLTNEKQKAFLALRPQLRNLDAKNTFLNRLALKTEVREVHSRLRRLTKRGLLSWNDSVKEQQGVCVTGWRVPVGFPWKVDGYELCLEN
ncbi:hypothetical protein NDU88_004206 [Pleurodeles waltl]|uniref:L1 transposable element RRM domain-containing protein n=1 Tax=Pleurodeles waltl TaxID=8319 RepID=A0AAV7SI52_PLEWA|nr:hypothetical protein NDU88_004206 [Pleurodeles waltl]